MGCCESIMRVVLGSGVGSGGNSEVELGGASRTPFTMDGNMKGRDVVVEGGKVSGTGLALGCAPVEQVREKRGERGDWRCVPDLVAHECLRSLWMGAGAQAEYDEVMGAFYSSVICILASTFVKTNADRCTAVVVCRSPALRTPGTASLTVRTPTHTWYVATKTTIMLVL